MADQKISELTALTGANVADDDAIAIVDTSATETKKIVFSELKNALDTATGFVRITGDTMTGDLNVLANVGIGTSSPNRALTVEDGDIQIHDTGTSGDPLLNFSVGGTQASPTQSWSFRIDNSDSDKFQLMDVTDSRIVLTADGSGNVGIGTSDPHDSGVNFSMLTLNGAKGGGIVFSDNDVNQYQIYTTDDASLRFSRGANLDSESMRIDSSGNVYVGGTTYEGSTTSNASSSYYGANGFISANVNNDFGMQVNRTGTDGTLFNFRKNGADVGSIGTHASNITIGTGATGLRFYDTDNVIMPRNPSTGASVSGTISLGEPLNRFKDLHLSGTIEIENGTGNVGVGKQALNSSTSNNNTAVGYQAGYTQSTNGDSTYVGYQAGYLRTGTGNTCIGNYSGRDGTTGADNTLIGRNAGYKITNGSDNTIIGTFDGNQGGLDIRTSSNNIVLADGDGNPRVWVKNGYFKSSNNNSFNQSSHVRHEFNQSATGEDTLVLVSSASSAPYGAWIRFTGAAPNDTSRYFLQCQDTTGARAYIYSNGNVVNSNNSYGAISDQKVKENIVDSGSQWDDIKALTVRKYSMKSDSLDAPNMLGVIAQEVEAAGMGGLVFESPDIDPETKEDLGTVTKQVNYSILYMKAVKALQEAMDRIETLEAKVTALENA